MKELISIVYVETELKCPHCCNFLYEIIKIPNQGFKKRNFKQQDFIIAENTGYYCQNCGSEFPVGLDLFEVIR